MTNQYKDKPYNDYGQWIRQRFPVPCAEDLGGRRLLLPEQRRHDIARRLHLLRQPHVQSVVLPAVEVDCTANGGGESVLPS